MSTGKRQASSVPLRRHRRVMVDRLTYAIDYHGTPGMPRVLLLHGFMGSGRSWKEIVAALGDAFDVMTVDLPGHGATTTPWMPSRASVEETAADIAGLIADLGIGPFAVVGYSLGARIALRLACAHRSVVRALVLESPSAGIPGDVERAARRTADEALAARLERDGLEAFVDSWEAQPLFASQADLPETVRAFIRSERLANDARGLAMSLRGAGQGAMEPLGESLFSVVAPTLVIAGALDPVGRSRAEGVARGIPGARLAIVPDAGHRVHLERPAVFTHLLIDAVREAPAA